MIPIERLDELLGGLYPWQREYLQNALQVRYAGLSIPRGAGKSHLAAALAVAVLEQAEQPGEIAIVSATVAQARTAIFDPAEYWLNDRKSEYQRQVAGNNIAIERRDLPGCRIRLLGSNPRSAHGLIPHLIICDELAQWAPNTAARLVAALRTSLGKRPDAKMMALSTRGGTPEMCEFERWLRTCDYSMIYTADDGDQWNDSDTWYKCNPSLRYQPEMQAVYADEANKAETDEGFKAAFIALRLNRGGADHQRTMLIDADRWRDVEADIAPIGRNVVWGLDIGSQASLTAAACYHADSGLVRSFGMFGSEPNLTERSERLGVGDLLIECETNNEIVLSGRRIPVVDDLLSECLERFEYPEIIVCDAWRYDDLIDGLERLGISCVVERVRMGYYGSDALIRDFRRAVSDGRVRPLKSRLLRASMAQAQTEMDIAGNERFMRSAERPLNDLAVAVTLAVGTGYAMQNRYAGSVDTDTANP